jgi:hypothetical protein
MLITLFPDIWMLWKNICKILDPPAPASMESQEKFSLQELLDCRKRPLSPPDANNCKGCAGKLHFYGFIQYSIVLTIAIFPLHKYTDPSKKCTATAICEKKN